HLDSNANGECTHDITHEWGAQHRSWNGGRMDGFVREHVAVNGPDDGPLTMGFYTAADLAFYHGLAKAFTICDRSFCSSLGPTKPTYPDDFLADAKSGKLPQVCWVLPGFSATEHPPAAPMLGEFETARVFSALASNHKLWAKTAMFLTYDENGGFFDHVPPPVA